MAERCRVTLQRIQQIEQGRANLTVYSLVGIANLTVYSLVGIANVLQVPAWRLLLVPGNAAPKARAGRPRVRQNDPAYRPSIYRGVSFKDGRWRAKIQHEGEQHALGSFDQEEDAARAYDRAGRKFHKREAQLNFPRSAEEAARSRRK